MTGKQMLGKLAWRLVLVANVLGTFLVVRFAMTEFRNARESYVGSLNGVLALVIWGYFELVFALFTLAVSDIVKSRKVNVE